MEECDDGKPCCLCQECTERLLNAYEFICSVEKAELDIENYLKAEKGQLEKLVPLSEEEEGVEEEEELKEEIVESTEIDVQDIEILDEEFQTEQEQLIEDEVILPEITLPAEIQEREPIVEEEFDSNT